MRKLIANCHSLTTTSPQKCPKTCVNTGFRFVFFFVIVD
jgi:hypothetical protein